MQRILILIGLIFWMGCKDADTNQTANTKEQGTKSLVDSYAWNSTPKDGVDSLLKKYTPFTLKADMSSYTSDEKKMIKKLIEVGEIMDKLFWYESYGNEDVLLNDISDARLKTFARINYGPWDRLNGNASFVDGIGEKPKGANYYPKDMTKEEFEKSDVEGKSDLYTFLRRDEGHNLVAVPYHKMFADDVKKASELLDEASTLTTNTALKKYLQLRAKAMLDDNYQESDMAWLDMKDNNIDVVD